jgi:hypothetical protein
MLNEREAASNWSVRPPFVLVLFLEIVPDSDEDRTWFPFVGLVWLIVRLNVVVLGETSHVLESLPLGSVILKWRS